MRDPKRIETTLTLIKGMWEKHPDLRFNQLLYILMGKWTDNHDGRGKVVRELEDDYPWVGYDLFNVEDDLFIEFLRGEEL